MASFLSTCNRQQQRVKIANVFSSWKCLNGGMPQGSWLGPLIFVVLIDDLRSDCPLYKFIDDTTYSEVLTVSQTSNMQTYYNELQQWSADNFMQVNASKTKEIVIGKRTVTAPSLYTPNSQPIDGVEEFKLLGVWVSANLTWNKHVDQMIY